MTIHEVEARIKLGPIKLGKRVGNVVEDTPRGEPIVLETGNTVWDPLDGVMFTNRTMALITQPDEIAIAVATRFFTYEVTRVLKGKDIKQEPLLRKRFKYIP